jgi:ATP-binding cassette subfamily B (MDR/TAP) protein 1
MVAGERQAIKFRTAYFASLVKQEIGFYDIINANEIAYKVSIECYEIQKGLGLRCSTFI